jgi:isopentenyldiphosphate isomerase
VTIEEMIDVVDPVSGDATGDVRSKRDVHRDGLWHRSVHVWVVNAAGALLLQQRALMKENHPGMWDVSAAGHISSGEDSLQSACRELDEEIGVAADAASLTLILRTKETHVLNDGAYVDRKLHDVFVLHRDVDPSSLRLQAEEVMATRLVPLEELRAMVTQRDPSLVPHWDEYERVIAYVSSLRDQFE